MEKKGTVQMFGCRSVHVSGCTNVRLSQCSRFGSEFGVRGSEGETVTLGKSCSRCPKLKKKVRIKKAIKQCERSIPNASVNVKQCVHRFNWVRTEKREGEDGGRRGGRRTGSTGSRRHGSERHREIQSQQHDDKKAGVGRRIEVT